MKTKLDEKLALGDELKEILSQEVLKFGKISPAFLMRKLKVSESRAKEIYNTFMNAT